MTGQVVVKGTPGQRVMALITSNAYKDRDKEFVSAKALHEFVGWAWKAGEFTSYPLWFWHDDPPIGEVLWADMEGRFLIEVAKETENPFARPVWDHIQAHPQLYRVSHGFQVLEATRTEDGRVFEKIRKVETSVLPLSVEANVLTGVEFGT